MKLTKVMAVVFSISLAFVLLISLVACSPRVKAEDVMEDIKPANVEAVEIDEAFIENQMRLAVKLLQATNNETKDENLLISPISIQLALAMTANGADGDTLAEMQTLLGDEIPLKKLNEYLYTYVNLLPSSDKYKVEIANSIWFKHDERLTINESFLQTNSDYYNAQVFKSAFNSQTVTDINNWVKSNTNGMIDKIINKIPEDAVMYLINAVAFDAEWQSKYEGYNVNKGTFTSVDGEAQRVDMMHSTESKYIELENATGFAKNYKEGKYSFVAILPNADISISEFVDTLDSSVLYDAVANAKNSAVITTMPKFSYEYSLTMNEALKKLGMPSAFSYQTADFSRMGSYKDAALYIGNVLHKTYIAVDELGTKASAVTKIEMLCGSALPPSLVVNLDRPFLYMIVENETSLPLFMGVLTSIR